MFNLAIIFRLSLLLLILWLLVRLLFNYRLLHLVLLQYRLPISTLPIFSFWFLDICQLVLNFFLFFLRRVYLCLLLLLLLLYNLLWFLNLLILIIRNLLLWVCYIYLFLFTLNLLPPKRIIFFWQNWLKISIISTVWFKLVPIFISLFMRFYCYTLKIHYIIGLTMLRIVLWFSNIICIILTYYSFWISSIKIFHIVINIDWISINIFYIFFIINLLVFLSADS